MDISHYVLCSANKFLWSVVLQGFAIRLLISLPLGLKFNSHFLIFHPRRPSSYLSKTQELRKLDCLNLPIHGETCEMGTVNEVLAKANLIHTIDVQELREKRASVD